MMRPSIALLSFLPLTLALPYDTPHLQKRASTDLANETLSEIAALSSAVTDLTDAVNAFDGSLLTVIPQSLAVITAETKLDATILKATWIVKQSANFTDAESSSIVSALANLITPIQGSLTALTDKYETFKQTLESPIVLLDLKILKAHTDDLIDAVTAKVTETNAGLLGLGTGVIDQAFDAAITVYEG
ncbi:hypothetical protein K491DRAFT_436722 [Lophiostoma macrostomum CBS 122681]|uniref:Hydrophobic surface binding protein A n=1 Tax=Lophiostoma macrostomum CBS 122681 TaxID=1314788 RepID=A0A6A6T738_9PLEO|nr:hypothetical protein K491DRAFT_436722 [Lophiostoma macrostomum CBS 122681]